MRHIDEDTITQAVIARHAAASDMRLRELMTSLVQHLHGFAREVKLTEAERAAGLRFLADCGREASSGQPELSRLSDALGLTALVTSAMRREPRGCTEACAAAPWRDRGGPQGDAGERGQACYVSGSVRALDGTPIAGAEVRVGRADTDAPHEAQRSGPDGAFLVRTVLGAARAPLRDGPVARLLEALGRPAWRPAHLPFTIRAPGFEPLVTEVFRRGDPQLDADAAFGVRSSLVADWVRHPPGRTPDGRVSDEPFTTLEFCFVLDHATTGDRP